MKMFRKILSARYTLCTGRQIVALLMSSARKHYKNVPLTKKTQSHAQSLSDGKGTAVLGSTDRAWTYQLLQINNALATETATLTQKIITKYQK